MYTEYFGLSDAPFSIAPNPQYLFMTRRHRDALAHLLYGVQSDGGFILLTGEVGTGKTTVCRCLLEQMPDHIETAFVLNPRLSAPELLQTICDEFNINYNETLSLKILIDKLNTFLLESHSNDRKTILIIDEAQNLSYEVLEQLRLLTNLETNARKLLQIILIGQPELLEMLKDKSLRQLSQRITARFHLDSLKLNETKAYIGHRMLIAGGDPKIFNQAALEKIYRISRGTPRVINLICDRALLGAYAENKRDITPRIIRRAASEVLGIDRRNVKPLHIAAIAFTLLITITFYLILIPEKTMVAIRDQNSAEGPTSNLIIPPQDSIKAVAKSNIQGHMNRSLAYHDLFTLWGVNFEDKARPPCVLAKSIGLSCLERTASLTELIKLNRPVIIQISGEYFTLAQIINDSIILIVQGEQFDLTHLEFKSLYNGKLQMLWRMPPGYKRPLKKNDRGAAVDWLMVQLSAIEGNPSPTHLGFIFTNSLEKRVKNFQTRLGLPPNGIVDPLTWIHLNDIEAMNIPTLISKGQG